ncbi:MAG: DUF4445 domain-containing protein [candidate division NC10 bacterium]|nr:DUF4445 domain-containing protein [candidate division NC10 bacterium]
MSDTAKPAATVRITFLPRGEEVTCPAGTSLLDAARRLDLHIEAACGGNALCKKCKVQVLEGGNALTPVEREYLTAAELQRGIRLSCRVECFADARAELVSVEVVSLAKLRRFGKERAVQADSDVAKHPATLALTPGEPGPLCRKIPEALPARPGGYRVDQDFLRTLSPDLVKEGALLTLVTVGDELVGVEAGDTREACYGIAVDIGSTTIAGYLVDLNRGITVTSTAVSNSQKEYGHDIMTRIAHCMRDPEGLATLHGRTVEDVGILVKDLSRRGRVPLDRIYRMTLVGNPAMHHLFFRLPVQSLGLAPYVPLYRDRVDFRPAAMGIELPSACRATFLPAISGFVGADIVGMILATGLVEGDALTLAVDIGTNGESVLGTRERFLCCSAPAGPAFEGAQIRDGMRAVKGAIDRVDVGERVTARVIGGGKAEGICGSGLIDAVAGLLDYGVIDPTGRLQDPADLPGSVPAAVRSRVHLEGEDRWVELVPAEATAHGRPIVVSQADVRQLQLAKGAIAGSGRYLMQRLGVGPGNLEQVVLAGAFGSFVRAESAIRIGLIPAVPLKKVRGVGNAAGAGARLALASREYLQKAEAIQQQAEYVELAGHDDFMEVFVEAMNLPPAPPPL